MGWVTHSFGLAAQGLAWWVLGLRRRSAGSGEQDAGDAAFWGLWVHPLALLIPGLNPSKGISALTVAKGCRATRLMFAELQAECVKCVNILAYSSWATAPMDILALPHQPNPQLH